MTELYELYKTDRAAAKEKLQGMEVGRLLAELDDTLQFDVMYVGTLDWMKMPGMELYRAIVSELRKRCQ